MSEPDSAAPDASRMSASVMSDRGLAHNVAMPDTSQPLVPAVDAEPVTQPGRTRRRDRAVAGDRWIARVLRGGAVVSGGMLVVSLGLEALPRSENVDVAIDLLRKGAASMLLVTPVARLAVAGTLLGLKGEWRYTVIAAGVLGLLAIAVGAGIHT